MLCFGEKCFYVIGEATGKAHGENQVHHQQQQTDEPRDRPPLVTNEVVIVAISIITTAPARNWSPSAPVRELLSSTSHRTTNSAIWTRSPARCHTQSSRSARA